ncbi:quinone oxidoreductase [Deinococcus sp. KNUC1210]|uniref:quinone oxidoreductase family protein n=1 Tax=Deinococcus sp. KNUC1210 TaxID=2917691 RepID=UPI001EF02103|nr:quinone oxidoreductase [Deinococcus sp. KNUC1210]ULH15417.1 quinone oxidoreductase [Deinococcus sp. KNUC1210]
MQAIQITENGGPEVLKLQELPLSPPAPGEAQVRLTYAGLNFVDVYQRQGGRQAPRLPAVLGKEGAGVVTAVGEGVEGLTAGQRVAFGTAARGAYAEAVNLPAWQLAPVPDSVSDEQAAAVMLQGMTAHYLTHSTFALASGQLAVVHAAAGGVGGLLVQIAARLGVTVLATAGSPDKLALARELGAQLTAGYDQFASLAREHGGAHVVYDGVGKATFDAGLDALRVRGLMCLYGAASGAVPPIDPQLLNEKGGLFLTRPSLVYYAQTAEELRWRASDLFAWIAAGELKVRIDRVFPLAQVADAHRYIEGRNTLGKVLLSL